MNVQQGYDVLVKEVYAPIFFGKLASEYGIEPSSEEEAIRMLKMAAKLRNAYELNRVKTAGERTDRLAAAEEQLDSWLSDNFGHQTQSEDVVKEATVNAYNLPYVREAALAFSEYMAQQN